MSKSLEVVRAGQRILVHNGVSFRITIGNHAKFRLTLNGKNAVVVTPLTPSDRRAVLNFYSELKRAMVKIGCPVKPDSKRFLHN